MKLLEIVIICVALFVVKSCGSLAIYKWKNRIDSSDIIVSIMFGAIAIYAFYQGLWCFFNL